MKNTKTNGSTIFETEGRTHLPEEIKTIAEELKKAKTYKKKSKDAYASYYNLSCAFDIETTSFYESGEKRACMYEWTLGLQGRVIIGRTWEEFTTTMDSLAEVLQLSEEKRLIIYVHNLSFEFGFIGKRFEWASVFALDTRKVCYALTTSGIEFRCSYILSGYSLAGLSKQLIKYPAQKLVGDLDYDLLRHSSTYLSTQELKYCENDVRVVMNYIQEQIETEGRITFIPLTKTSYVRRFCRKNCLPYKGGYKYKKLMKALTLESNEYKMLKRAFQGGFTHANAAYVGRTMENVHSVDFTSSYPAVMCAFKNYPISRGENYTPSDLSDFKKQIKLYCCIFDIMISNVKLKEGIPDCYLSRSKCYMISEDRVLNNGRVFSASKLVTTMTEIDFEIFEKCYTFDTIAIVNLIRYHKGYLPSGLIKSVLSLYEDKTKLKGVEGSESDYMLKKGMLNSTFGCCVTDPCRDEIIYDDIWTREPADVSECLEKYNKSRSRFLFYAWGVYITALARKMLWHGILAVGMDDYIYADTDSIKFLNYEKHTDYIESYNKWITEKLEKACKEQGIDPSLTHPESIDGEAKPLGVWDYEGNYNRFKTLGAKRYMTEKDGKLSITVSGVNKKVAVPYLVKKYKDPFKAFNDELFIPEDYTGKLIHTYIEEPQKGSFCDYQGKEGSYNELSSVHLEKTSYDFSMTEEFLDFIEGVQERYYAGENEIL